MVHCVVEEAKMIFHNPGHCRGIKIMTIDGETNMIWFDLGAC